MSVSEEVHARAYLEHQKHSEAIVICVVQHLGLQNVKYVRCFQVATFSRCDGEVVNPYDDVVHINLSGGECIPPQDLLLYHNSGNSSTGLHYDPIMISMRESARAQRGDCRAEEKKGMARFGRGSKAGARPRRIADVPDPQQEEPTFLRIVSRHGKQDIAMNPVVKGHENCGKAVDVEDNVKKPNTEELQGDSGNMFYQVLALDGEAGRIEEIFA